MTKKLNGMIEPLTVRATFNFVTKDAKHDRTKGMFICHWQFPVDKFPPTPESLAETMDVVKKLIDEHIKMQQQFL